MAIFVTALAGACHRQDSILLVEVAGDLRLMPAQFQVRVEIEKRLDYKDFRIPATPTPITLPASFSIELDRSVTGPVTVRVQAYDTNTMFIGAGQTRQDHIKVGDDTIVVVVLTPEDGVIVDGGDPDSGSFDAGDPDTGDPDGGASDAAQPTDAEDQ